ncbi:MAG: glycerol kinase GlpK [Eubacterium sp.]|nr:glycerol kinase GlpK [Eubacterium sp.]
MGKYIMALDQGTTSSRTILFNHAGEIICQANKEFEQIFPKPGWVEHNPEEIWMTQLLTMEQVLKDAGIRGAEIDAIGITNQRETTVVWDRITGKPIYNAIVWQCRRTSDMIDELVEQGMEEVIRGKTGLVPDAYFSGTKIHWILEHVEGAREKAERGELLFGTIDSWLMWKLSGGAVHATDYTNASRTMIFNIRDLTWDEELLQKLQIPKSMLPKVLPSSGIFGYTTTEILGAKVPISGVAGDQQAALFGQCCFEKGDVKNTYGTGCFLLMNTGREPVFSKNGLVTTIAASTDEVEYALEGSVFIAGAAIQWLRDQLRFVSNASESEVVASTVEDTNDVYVVPAFTGMGAPYWKQDARGMIVGLTRGAGKEHIVRATLESLAYQTYDVLKAMEQDAAMEIKRLKVDGGACKNNLLMQFQADLIQGEVVRPQVIETTGLGAAYLAGLATGYWSGKEDIINNCSIDRTFSSQMEQDVLEKKLKGWKRAVKCAMVYADEK